MCWKIIATITENARNNTHKNKNKKNKKIKTLVVILYTGVPGWLYVTERKAYSLNHHLL
jgi:hypothetical protein